jgi:hypothetical protein
LGLGLGIVWPRLKSLEEKPNHQKAGEGKSGEEGATITSQGPERTLKQDKTRQDITLQNSQQKKANEKQNGQGTTRHD